MTAQFRLGRIRIVVSIPACHAGGRGSIPRFGERFCFVKSLSTKYSGTSQSVLVHHSHVGTQSCCCAMWFVNINTTSNTTGCLDSLYKTNQLKAVKAPPLACGYPQCQFLKVGFAEAPAACPLALYKQQPRALSTSPPAGTECIGWLCTHVWACLTES